MKRYLILSCIALVLTASCVSTRNTIRNIDDNAIMPALSKDKTFIITETSKDKKYGYDQDYPVNLGFLPLTTGELNVKRYFGALTGPNGQALTFTKTESCCPFPTKKFDAGAGLLDVYEVTWEGLNTPKKIYINLYEKGKVIAPHGFAIKPIAQ
ncbi:2-dehydro-3-deoxyphosphooctonate aldolase [Flavobacterium sp. DG1-102-2]|uniref:2-dehydro-3-deoxyphosphooctonate aldolase n=1 Tax=Flavobacterium sp. DG1-102-2 TaxID=3081663 RepID=UPI00294A4654|nr:2-dehydro-3-deoxyphosphooctonate aldolase [Flavobacterium sp. DG1-102-2]MDV6168155.1 2-dehydro-3-deoxyphosphooctonate aldolase [Flavobacterium sp. DG1-102-2]